MAALWPSSQTRPTSSRAALEQTADQLGRSPGAIGGRWRRPAIPTCSRSALAASGGSVEPAAVRDRALDGDQDDVAVGVGEAQDQDLGEHLRDLARREVDDRGDLAADEVLGAVVLDELGRAGLQPRLGPEVDDEAVGGLARRLVRSRLDDGADANVDLEEVVEGDGHAAASGAGSGPSAAPDRRGPSVHAVQRATVSACESRLSNSAIVLAWSGVSSRSQTLNVRA